MRCIYVGDSGNVATRVATNHCSGDVAASHFCKHVACAMGYSVVRAKGTKGKLKWILASEDPTVAKKNIKTYIQSGKWRYVLCESPCEARDFQWYAIKRLNPKLNKERKSCKTIQAERYGQLFDLLIRCPLMNASELRKKAVGPGVYAHYNPSCPPLLSGNAGV